MKLTNKVNWIGSNELAQIKNSANLHFGFGEYDSLDDILEQLDVEVLIVPGIHTRAVPNEELQNIISHLMEMADLCGEEQWQEKSNLWENVHKVNQWMENWGNMPLRGIYNPDTNTIELYPDEMTQEYNGQRLKELLVSTLAHETMHAYFNRPKHEQFPYLLCVEEPLAEFGMLHYLHTTNSNFYQWAYDDVKAKKTCYSYGAEIMDYYQRQSSNIRSAIIQYLEDYKVLLNQWDLIDYDRNNGKLILPTTSNQSSPITLGGTTFMPNWKDVFSLPRYFWDEKTHTLGLSGFWGGTDHEWRFERYLKEMMERFNSELFHKFHSDDIKYLYLADDFCLLEDCHRLQGLIERCKPIISLNNPYYILVKGVIMTKDHKVSPFYEECGNDRYIIPVNGGGYKIVDSEAKEITKQKYDYIWSFDDNGLCMVRIDDTYGYTYGYINYEGEEQIPVIYEDIYSFENGITVAKKGGRYGIIDEHNNIIHNFDLDYPDMRELRNGYATMKDAQDKWGAIDSKGNVVIPCKYDSLVVFDKDGKAEVELDGKELVIDINGNQVN